MAVCLLNTYQATVPKKNNSAATCHAMPAISRSSPTFPIEASSLPAVDAIAPPAACMIKESRSAPMKMYV